MGKAETASRNKNVSGAADSGESRDGGTRAVSFSDPRHNEFRKALGGVIAAFFMLYIYQHFRCIDLSFQLEDVKGRQAEAASLNASLKLEIAGLRNPMRIDIIARRQLGLTEPLPTQVQEYEAPDGRELAAVRSLRPNRAP